MAVYDQATCVEVVGANGSYECHENLTCALGTGRISAWVEYANLISNDEESDVAGADKHSKYRIDSR